MLDDLDELRTFQRILALGSLSAAARDLGVGLAVVSKRLSTLERRLGQRLIHRTTRRLSPTEDGLALVPYVDRVLEEIAAAEARLAEGRAEPQGVLRVSAPISFARVHLLPLAAELADRHQRLEIEFALSDRIADLIDARIDLAVRIGQPRDSSAVMIKLADNHRILVAAPAYLDRRGVPDTPAARAAHDGLRFDDSAAPWRREGPDGAIVEIEPRSRLRANSGDAALTWALAGCGVMLKSRADVAGDVAAGRLVHILPSWRSAAMPVYALMPSARNAPLKTRVFIDALKVRLTAL